MHRKNYHRYSEYIRNEMIRSRNPNRFPELSIPKSTAHPGSNTEPCESMAYDLLSTPALVINEKVVSSGKIPTKAEVQTWLTSARSWAAVPKFGTLRPSNWIVAGKQQDPKPRLALVFGSSVLGQGWLVFLNTILKFSRKIVPIAISEL